MPRLRLLLPLALLAILAVSQPARSLANAEGPTLPLELAIQTSEEESEGGEEGECSEGEGEGGEEAEEECEAEAEEAGSSAAGDCSLRTATARVVAYPKHQMMRLTLGYTTYAPTAATVAFGAKKDPHLGTAHRRLGHSGVVRLSKHLAAGQMDKVETSGRFTVTVHVPEAPPACRRFEVQQLHVAQSSDARVTWVESR